MSVTALPPRGSLPLSPRDETQAAPERKDVQISEGPRDLVDRQATRMSGPQGARMGLLDAAFAEGEVEGEAAFALLAAQIGEQRFEGMRVAARLEIDAAALQGPALASLALSEVEIAATLDLTSLIAEGVLELPPELEGLVRDAQLLIEEVVTRAQVDTLLSRLSATERAAFSELAQALGPMFSGLQRSKAAQPRSRLARLREKGKLRVGRALTRATIQDIEPEELRELFEELLGGGQGREGAASLEVPEATPDAPLWIEPELRGIAELSDLVLPPLDFSAVEAAWAEALPRLNSLDPEDLASLLMLHCAASHEGEMGEILARGSELATTQKQLRAAIDRAPGEMQSRAQLAAAIAESDALADRLELHLARRAAFAAMARAMLRA